jgi:hypothetical protein
MANRSSGEGPGLHGLYDRLLVRCGLNVGPLWATVAAARRQQPGDVAGGVEPGFHADGDRRHVAGRDSRRKHGRRRLELHRHHEQREFVHLVSRLARPQQQRVVDARAVRGRGIDTRDTGRAGREHEKGARRR